MKYYQQILDDLCKQKDALCEGMTEEDTRFGGLKRECGLHEMTGDGDFQI